MRLVILLFALLVSATSAHAQDTEPGKFGINLRVQNSPQIGFDWRVSSSVTLRPTVAFSWSETEGAFGSENVTQYSLGLEVLARAATWDRLTSYYGIGAGFGKINGSSSVSGDVWSARLLLGARIKVVDRVAVFGELGLEYSDSEGFFGKRFDLRTFPLGVTVFLK